MQTRILRFHKWSLLRVFMLLMNNLVERLLSSQYIIKPLISSQCLEPSGINQNFCTPSLESSLRALSSLCLPFTSFPQIYLIGTPFFCSRECFQEWPRSCIVSSVNQVNKVPVVKHTHKNPVMFLSKSCHASEFIFDRQQ